MDSRTALVYLPTAILYSTVTFLYYTSEATQKAKSGMSFHEFLEDKSTRPGCTETLRASVSLILTFLAIPLIALDALREEIGNSVFATSVLVVTGLVIIVLIWTMWNITKKILDGTITPAQFNLGTSRNHSWKWWVARSITFVPLSYIWYLVLVGM